MHQSIFIWFWWMCQLQCQRYIKYYINISMWVHSDGLCFGSHAGCILFEDKNWEPGAGIFHYFDCCNNKAEITIVSNHSVTIMSYERCQSLPVKIGVLLW